ncbi:MAG TPA: 5'-methylthioadenosine/adenosylhomocysteine nucleosidase [Noviherbaspirillum sp.]|uniref:5'-methylthioadenosine/adenosylhomocysteine nucleosidase n=1 Tax=Noviherbaspirillum sp. TaxID=1926288 RepID=UPI002D2E0249|nr:5'-methylthioadenosine/adenosylhomocysteine nucleosidase [Noviherbaspirillum sp.]HYD96948.1 5'-methylthioadenosine/adenosylhomocysteine nucleosidase [Noviherbaspirillum sp.]
MSQQITRLGLVSALHQEQAGLIEAMQGKQTVTRGMRDYVCGSLWGIETVCVLSRIGKVAAAATVATLIERFGVSHIVFTGVAGAVDSDVQIGDIVVADALVQHDIDATPLFPRHEVPLLGQSHFATDVHLTEMLAGAANDFLGHDLDASVPAQDRDRFRLSSPRVYRGLIASGDQFIHTAQRHRELKAAFPGLLAVEMEGAAVAQVCFEFGMPFSVIRTISDGANEASPHDFMQFIDGVAARYAFGTVKRLCAAR